MVTLINIIERLLTERNVHPMRNWTQRFIRTRNNELSWYAKILIRKIRKLLNLISGNSIVSMLNDVLSKKEKEQLVPVKYTQTLKELSSYYSSIKLKQRHHFIRLFKIGGFSYKFLRNIGFKLSKKLWINCDNTIERNKGGGISISDDLKDSINLYLKEKSSIGSNRLIKNMSTDQFEPVRYLNDSVTVLFRDFPFKDELSISTFRKYLHERKIFKRPYRFTDLCDYCEWAKSIRSFIANLVQKENFDCGNTFEVKKLIIFLQRKLNNLRTEQSEFINSNATNEQILYYTRVIADLENYDTVMFHKNVAISQREAYNHQRKTTDYLRDKILIEADFKQKILIGLSPRQINKEYYKQEQRICLGFGIYYFDEIEGEIKLINFDLIWDDEHKQDAYSFIRAFRVLRDQEFFKAIDKKNYSVWLDCGKHFRNNLVIGYLFQELKAQGVLVNLNFFAEKHGKSGRDTHFSNISKFVKAESLVKQLRSSVDIVNAIIKRQDESNSNREFRGLKLIQTFAMHLESQFMTAHLALFPVSHSIIIENIESYYNFRSIDSSSLLMTSILSNRETLMPINITANQNSEVRHNMTFEPESFIDDTLITFQTLYFKNQRIRIALEKLNRSHVQNDQIRIQHETTIDKPPYCRDSATPKKKPCLSCNEICYLTLAELNHEVLKPVKSVILNELSNHGHPKSRNMENGLSRTLDEARLELIQHYKYAHASTNLE